MKGMLKLVILGTLEFTKCLILSESVFETLELFLEIVQLQRQSIYLVLKLSFWSLLYVHW